MAQDSGPKFDQPLETLAACHERIEEKLAALERLVPHLETHGCDPEARAAAQGILRYFDTSGVHHHQDEDQDLFPLLRQRAAAQGRAEIAAAIEELEREHETMDAQWRRLRQRLLAVVEGGPRLASGGGARLPPLLPRPPDRR